MDDDYIIRKFVEFKGMGFDEATAMNMAAAMASQRDISDDELRDGRNDDSKDDSDSDDRDPESEQEQCDFLRSLVVDTNSEETS